MSTTRKALLLVAAAAVAGMIGGTLIGHSQEGFAGTESCGMCHPNELKAYQEHTHASAEGGLANETGIGCEACHGAGEAHIALGPRQLQELAENDGDLKVIANNTSELCGACHGNGGEGINLSDDGLIMAMQSYNELELSRKTEFSITCVACHSPHVTSAGQEGIVRTCEACHTGKYAIEIEIKAMQDLSCEDCHMPYAVTTDAGVASGEYVKGQHRSHIFGITVDDDYEFNNGDSMVTINDDGLARLTIQNTCYACHKTGAARDRSDRDLYRAAGRIH